MLNDILIKKLNNKVNNLYDVVDISSKITPTSNVGTIYDISAYKKGNRCYLNAIFDLLSLSDNGSIFLIDNSILPSKDEIESATNYDTGNTTSAYVRINERNNKIQLILYGSKRDYCALHIEWEV